MIILRAFAVMALSLATGCAVAHSRPPRDQAQDVASSFATAYDAGFISVRNRFVGKFTINLEGVHRNTTRIVSLVAPPPVSPISATSTQAMSASASQYISFNSYALAPLVAGTGRPELAQFDGENAFVGAGLKGGTDNAGFNGRADMSTVSAVPEPSTYAAMLLGLGCMALAAQFRRSSPGRRARRMVT
jgi:hypothetical protein